MPARLTALSFFVILPAACGTPERSLDIPFIAVFEGREISCEQSSGTVSLTDLRFYVHDVELLQADGSPEPVRLLNDGTWQNDRVALIDLESGQGECVNGTFVQHARLQGTAPDRSYAGIRFVLGLPFELNHNDPLQAAAPLNDSAMHWHWRSGYKFLRAGIKTAEDGFWVHVGSTGCEGTVGQISRCSAPNRAIVEIPDVDPWQATIAVDLAEFVADGQLADGVPGDCSSGPGEQSCERAFDALGIDFPSGELVPGQRVFRKRGAQ